MKLQQEAASFSEGKRTQFSNALEEYAEPIFQYLSDNLHSTTETAEAKKRLTEAIMWAKHSSRLHGIK